MLTLPQQTKDNEQVGREEDSIGGGRKKSSKNVRKQTEGEVVRYRQDERHRERRFGVRFLDMKKSG